MNIDTGQRDLKNTMLKERAQSQKQTIAHFTSVRTRQIHSERKCLRAYLELGGL